LPNGEKRVSNLPRSSPLRLRGEKIVRSERPRAGERKKLKELKRIDTRTSEPDRPT